MFRYPGCDAFSIAIRVATLSIAISCEAFITIRIWETSLSSFLNGNKIPHRTNLPQNLQLHESHIKYGTWSKNMARTLY